MCLSNNLVDSIPGTFKSRPGGVHGVFQPGFLNESLDVGDLGGDGGRGGSHLYAVYVSIGMYVWLKLGEHTGIKQKSAVQ